MVGKEFLGNKKSENYKEIVTDFLEGFLQIGVNMSSKIHFHWHSHPFPSENLGRMGDQQEERFHQDFKVF